MTILLLLMNDSNDNGNIGNDNGQLLILIIDDQWNDNENDNGMTMIWY